MSLPEIKLRGFPWQTVKDRWASSLDKTAGEKYGWNPLIVKGMGRFGGGWAIKFGITVSGDFRDICIDMMLGSIRIKFPRKAPSNAEADPS